MALKKEITLPNGFTPNYFRIRRAILENPSGVVVVVQGFKDQTTRETPGGNVQALAVYENTFYLKGIEGGKKAGEMTYEDLYELLKSQAPEFSGATDC